MRTRAKSMGFLGLLLLAGQAVAAQDKAAEEAFRKIEETIEKAGTLSVKFHALVQKGADEKEDIKGLLQLKQGNRARVEFTSTAAGDVLMVSDGKKIRVVTSGPTVEEEAPKELQSRLAGSFVRAGPLFLMGAVNKDAPGPKEFLQVSALKTGPDDAGRKTLTYKFFLPQGPVDGFDAKLWYEPKTWKPSKRTLSTPGKFEVTETYDEVVVNGAIADERFATAPSPGANKDAEAAFQKIQEQIGKAKTVRLKFKVEAVMVGIRYGATGSLLLKDGGRARLDLKAALSGGEKLEAEYLFLSNGKIMKGQGRGAAAGTPLFLPPDLPEQEVPGNVDALLRGAVVHSAFLCLGAFKGDAPPGEGEATKKNLTMFELKAGEDDRLGKSLTYKLQIERDAWSMRLWYDPKTFRILKRSMFINIPHGGPFQFVETMEEYALNADLPDAEFVMAEPKGGVPVKSLGLREGWLHAIAFSPDGKLLAGAASDGSIKLWDPAAGREVTSLPSASGQISRSFAFSPDGKSLAAAASDSTLRLWDVGTGKELWAVSRLHNSVNGLGFSPDGTLLATVTNDQPVKLWDAKTGKEVGALRSQETGLLTVAFSPDGRLLAAGERRIRLWDVASRKELLTLPGHVTYVTALAFSPDGKLLASASNSAKTVKLWDPAGGKELRALWGHEEAVTSFTFSPDGKKLATGSGDKSVRVWDVATAKQTACFADLESGVASVAFSPDGKTLAASMGGKVRLWNLKDGESK